MERKDMNAMAEALERAGVDPAFNRFKIELAKLVQKHSGPNLELAITNVLRSDIALLRAVARFCIANVMPGEGHTSVADEAVTMMPSAGQPNEREAGHHSVADKAVPVVLPRAQPNGDAPRHASRAGEAQGHPRAASPPNLGGGDRLSGARNGQTPVVSAVREQSPLNRRMALVVAQQHARSILDTFKVRGHVIGDLTMRELSEIEGTNMRENALIARIRGYIANPEPDKCVRDYVGAAVLQGMLAGVNSDAA